MTDTLEPKRSIIALSITGFLLLVLMILSVWGLTTNILVLTIVMAFSLAICLVCFCFIIKELFKESKKYRKKKSNKK